MQYLCALEMLWIISGPKGSMDMWSVQEFWEIWKSVALSFVHKERRGNETNEIRIRAAADTWKF